MHIFAQGDEGSRKRGKRKEGRNLIFSFLARKLPKVKGFVTLFSSFCALAGHREGKSLLPQGVFLSPGFSSLFFLRCPRGFPRINLEKVFYFSRQEPPPGLVVQGVTGKIAISPSLPPPPSAALPPRNFEPPPPRAVISRICDGKKYINKGGEGGGGEENVWGKSRWYFLTSFAGL